MWGGLYEHFRGCGTKLPYKFMIKTWNWLCSEEGITPENLPSGVHFRRHILRRFETGHGIHFHKARGTQDLRNHCELFQHIAVFFYGDKWQDKWAPEMKEIVNTVEMFATPAFEVIFKYILRPKFLFLRRPLRSLPNCCNRTK